MSEKTIEELRVELDLLKKANLERELAIEKQKIEDAKVLEEKKARELQKEDLRKELMAELSEKSMIQKTTESVTDFSEKDSRFIKANKSMESVNRIAINMRKNIISELGVKEEDFDASGYPGANDYEKRVAWLAAGGKKRMLKRGVN